MTAARTFTSTRLRLTAHPAGAYAILLAGVFCISFTAIFTKWAAMPGPVAAAYRMTIATVALTIPLLWQARRRGTLFPQGSRWGVLGGLTFGLNLGLLNSALLLTSAATATLLDNTAPIWVGIGAMLFFGERLRWRYWAGLGLALTGAAVVTGFNPTAGFHLNPGDALALTGAIFYAAYLLVTQRGRMQLDTLSYLWLVAATAAVALFIASIALGLPLTGYSTARVSFHHRRRPDLADGRLDADQLRVGACIRVDGRGGAADPAGDHRAAVDPAARRAADGATGGRRRA